MVDSLRQGRAAQRALRTLLVLVLLAQVLAVLRATPSPAGVQLVPQVFYKRSTDGGATFGNFHSLSANFTTGQAISHVEASGVVHVAWDTELQNREIMYRRSGDGGVSFGNEVVVSDNKGDSSESDMAAAGNRLHVVWEEDVLCPDTSTDPNCPPGSPDPNKPADEAFHRASFDGGKTFAGPAFSISNSPDNHTRDTDPDIEAADGILGVVYEEQLLRTGSTTAFQDDVLFVGSLNGTTFTAPTNPTTNNGTGSDDEPGIAIGGGKIHVVYQKRTADAGGPGYTGGTPNADGTITWTTPVVLPSIFRNSGLSPKVAASGNVVHVVTCGNSVGPLNSSANRDLFYYRSSDGGATSQRR